jgi:Protein of unknwon function (DUF3310)
VDNKNQEDPNSYQVGGAHYKTAAGFEHWDLAGDLEMGYFEGQISKYATRWKKKNGLEDAEKALHYFDKLCSLYAQGRRRFPRYPVFNREMFERFAQANKISSTERTIFLGLLLYVSYEELAAVRPTLLRLIVEAGGRPGDIIDSQRCPHGMFNPGNCDRCRGSLKPLISTDPQSALSLSPFEDRAK